jgi:predicted lipase
VEKRTVQLLAECSQAAYKLKYKHNLPRLGVTVCKVLRDQNNQIRGFLGVRDGIAIVSIKGTASLKDAEIDANIERREFNGTMVHSGFYNCYKAVRNDVMQFVRKHEHVLITGHSLGAAIASLLAVAIALDTHVDLSIATFGSPRVGDNAFVNLFNSLIKDSVRVVHEFDIVTRVPKAGFNHVDTLLHLNDNGQKVGRFRSACNFLRDLVSFGEIVLADLDGEALRNHHVAAYVRAARKYAKCV